MTFNFENYEDSFDSMNSEHLQLIYMINNFYIAYNNNKNHSVFLDLFDDLEAYVIAHFQLEEVYYRKYHLANVELKYLKNELLIEKMEEFRNKFVLKEVDKKDLLEFLFNWIIAHFKGHEIGFDNFIATNNLDFLYKLNATSQA